MTRVLGVVLAGGQSRRFGSDKTVALLDGIPLIDRVVGALTPQVDAVVISGRPPGLADRPGGGLGPLAGLNAALYHALATGCDWVVSVPCDTPALPADLVERLRGVTPAFVSDAPVIGWWPVRLADRLDAHLAGGGDRSLRGWARSIDARAIDLGVVVNVNTAEDLARLSARSAAPRRA